MRRIPPRGSIPAERGSARHTPFPSASWGGPPLVQDAEARREMETLIRERYADYYPVITVDRAYV